MNSRSNHCLDRPLAIAPWVRFAVLVFLSVVPTEPALSQDRVEAVAGKQYAVPPGGQTFVWGENYRGLWATPIRVERLDLGAVGGGLAPVRRVGGEQTLGLALRGGDGKSYTFRSVDKDLTHVLPDFLRIEALEEIAQDQLSATIPGAEVVVYPFARALGLIESEARLVVMPDDPSLGEFRELFAGRLGLFLEFPQSGFQGTLEIQDPDTFWKQRQDDPHNRADSETFLRARLLDLFLGDWDRHRGQWRWARVAGKERLQPVPEDRDQVFCDFQGLAMDIARNTGGQMVEFEDRYAPLYFGTQNGWDLDRFILTDLERERWMAIAEDTRARLTDEVIDEALGRLPEEYFALVGESLRTKVAARRDGLVDLAAAFYEYLSRKVDVQGSNRSEVATIEPLEDGSLTLRLKVEGESEPYYERRFRRDETREIRLYLHGGDDRVVAAAPLSGRAIKVHVVDGPGDVAIENDSRSLEVWNDDGVTHVAGSGSTKLHTAPFEDPGLKNPNENVPWVPSRDWGRIAAPRAVFGYHSDAGVVVGGGLDRTNFGFRRYPWSSRNTLLGAFAIGVNRPFVDYQGDFRRVDRTMHLGIESRFSGLDQLRYYGLGNETSNDGPNDSYAISLYQFTIFPALTFSRSAKGRFLIGPVFKFSDATGTEAETVLARENPTGFGRVAQLGAKAELRYDSRVEGDVFAAGFELDVEGGFYPKLMDIERDFGFLQARLDIHRPLSKRLFLDLAVGGKRIVGDSFPFFEAAYLGGRSGPGYNWNRFAGDASVYGLANLKIILHQVRKVVPGELGVSLLANAGRVWLDSEPSSKWHPSYGAGVFFVPFSRFALIEAGVGKSSEKTFFILRAQTSFLEF